MTSPYDIDRNDVEAALRVYEEAIAAGVGRAELDGVARTLLRLQDDPADLCSRACRGSTAEG